MNTTTKTRHSDTCCKAFAKLDPSCPRCQELAAGAPARRGWGPPVRSLLHGTMPTFDGNHGSLRREDGDYLRLSSEVR